jgi:plasmid stability protein
MAQLTIRADDDLVNRVRRRAASSGRSMNEYVTWVLDTVTNPELAGTERERLRERLRAAGLLTEWPRYRGPRPDPEAVRAAAGRAAHGTLLSDIVSQDRD